MAHRRIRQVVPTAATGSYSKAVLADGTLYLSGQTGAGLDGSAPVPGDAGPHAPASTGVIVDGLASPAFLVEIDATAVLG